MVGFVSVGQDLIPFENKGLGLWGFRSQDTGDIVIETKYDEVGGFNQGISSVRIGQLWEFIDQKGKIVIQPKFDSVDNFTDGVSQVWVRNSHGVFLMNKKGKISVSLIYDDGVVSTGGLFPVRKKKKWGALIRQERKSSLLSMIISTVMGLVKDYVEWKRMGNGEL